MQITINKKLLLKSMLFSLVITVLLMIMAYLPIWSVMTAAEKISIPIYVLMISPIVIFLVLTAVFYFDIRKILERKFF
jgi:hypothetical protein